jgi:hypothetical protein
LGLGALFIIEKTSSKERNFIYFLFPGTTMAKRKREDGISSADTKSPISGKNIIDFISSFENPSHVLAMTNVVNFGL